MIETKRSVAGAALGLVTAALCCAVPASSARAAEGTRYRVVDSFKLDDGRKLQTVELEDYKCFQPNTQFPPTDEADRKLVNGDWGNHEFIFVEPSDYQGGPMPIFLFLRGGGFAWVDTSVPADQIPAGQEGVAWGEKKGAGLYFNFLPLSVQWWTRKHGYSAFTFAPLPLVPGQAGSKDRFLYQLHQRFPSWGIIYPSYCSRDAYVGRGETTVDSKRYGYVALLAALDWVNQNYGIEYLFVGGTSAGGLGSAVIARDLPKDRPQLQLLGALVDSGPAEGQRYGDLNDVGVVNGLRRIVVEGDQKAWIHCDDPRQDLTRGLGVIHFLDFSLTRAIESGQITVPLFHAWQTRDHITLCGDLEYSEKYMDGAIARAITKYNPGGASVNYEKCEGKTKACTAEAATPVASCPQDEIVEIPCSKHGAISSGPNVADALDWMQSVIDRRPAKARSPSE